jgi:hypothetical protein
MEVKQMEQRTILDKSLFKLINGVIVYKGKVPMWACASHTLENYTFSKSVWEDGDKEYNEHYVEATIICEDDLGDLYTYGMWDNEKSADDWLSNPTRLY